jgi:UDP-GlcNAc:undecaprenyl-phosphate GlcNAc-1-phosphate transferase
MSLALMTLTIAFGVALLMTPLTIRLATRYGVVAIPNRRSSHTVPMPRAGGVALYVAVIASLWLAAGLSGTLRELVPFTVATAAVTLVGLLDDVFHLRSYTKLGGQTAAACLAVALGFRIDTLHLFSDTAIPLGIVGTPLSILWLVAITNAFNLMDGLDGLAGGCAAITAVAVGIGSAAAGEPEYVLAALAVAFACCGFLVFNFEPACVFMGDCGSHFLGFALAVLSMKAFSHHEGGGFEAPVAGLLFLLPLYDLVLSVVRRVAQGGHPFAADRKHVHHRLLDFGLSDRSAVLGLYFLTCLSSLAAMALVLGEAFRSVVVMLIPLSLTTVVLKRVGCFDFGLPPSAVRERRRGVSPTPALDM